MDFQKVIYENVEKNTSIFAASISIQVIDVLKFYEVLFCTYFEGLFYL